MRQSETHCLHCKAEMPKRDGRGWWRYCNDTCREAGRKLYNRELMLQREYGLSLDDYERMLAEQGGVCGICHEASDETLAVDHDHATDEVRGLLCSKCNRGIGYFDDNIERLMNAAHYLDRRTQVEQALKQIQRLA